MIRVHPFDKMKHFNSN